MNFSRTRGRRDNCEISDLAERDLNQFDLGETLDWDFYSRVGQGGQGGCLDGKPVCGIKFQHPGRGLEILKRGTL